MSDQGSRAFCDSLQQIDWSRVLEDIAWQLGEADLAFPHVRRPAGTRAMAAALHINRSTLLRWVDGAEPRHSDGEMLLAHWCRMTGKSLTFAPRCRASLSAAKFA